MSKEAAQEGHGGFRGRINVDFLRARKIFIMRDDDTVDGAMSGNGNAIDDSVNRPPQIFQAGDQSDIEMPMLKFSAKGGRMIEIDRSGPAVNQRPSIKIFDAANAQHLSRVKGIAP